MIPQGAAWIRAYVLEFLIVVSAEADSDQDTIIGDLSPFPEAQRGRELQRVPTTRFDEWQKICLRDPHKTFFVSSIAGAALLGRLRSKFPVLREGLARPIARGVTPDCVLAHVLSDSDREFCTIEDEVLRPSVSGKTLSQTKSGSFCSSLNGIIS